MILSSPPFGIPPDTRQGAIEGNGRQVWLQIVGFLFVIGWNLVWTSLILLFIRYVLRIPLRMSEEQLIAGDDAIHGEAAYVLGPCEAHERLLSRDDMAVDAPDVSKERVDNGRGPVESM